MANTHWIPFPEQQELAKKWVLEENLSSIDEFLPKELQDEGFNALSLLSPMLKLPPFLMCNPIAPRYQYGILIDTLCITEHTQMNVEEANGYGESMSGISATVLNISYCIGNKITNTMMTLHTPYNEGLARIEPNRELSILAIHSNSFEDSEIRAENEKEEETIWGHVTAELGLDTSAVPAWYIDSRDLIINGAWVKVGEKGGGWREAPC